MSINKLVKPFVFLVLLQQISCSTLVYTEPKEEPQARVRFITNTTSISVLRSYEGDNCANNENEWMRLRVGHLINSTPKKLGIPLWQYQENSAKEVYVKADQNKYFMFFGNVTSTQFVFENTDRLLMYSVDETPRWVRRHAPDDTPIENAYFCGTPFSYTFAKNKDYEVEFKVTPARCTVTISEVVRKGNAWKKIQLSKFNNSVNNTNRGCLNRLLKQRAF